MAGTNKAYISCVNLLYYPPQNYLEVKKDLEQKYDPTGLKCTINANKEGFCTFKENTKVKFSKGQEPGHKDLIALDW
ncbi:hypothetical protein MHLP_01495 [Candidatus Mycoplasma haematolamae str. Purdue]|uniref:Uncharacterized protein n=1 Tax=Mycoplasma haematolamae (strain Purdue) TaxID=1212765 RepID=I7CJ28_MYCHA|nr:hypothetical protein [Candidatus Mycoplasma haematolamae]AFO51879.1 hypothetical protein MHLP_01495 [Candidatus Mycoplasma haematolamae str. Purdue]